MEYSQKKLDAATQGGQPKRKKPWVTNKQHANVADIFPRDRDRGSGIGGAGAVLCERANYAITYTRAGKAISQ